MHLPSPSYGFLPKFLLGLTLALLTTPCTGTIPFCQMRQPLTLCHTHANTHTPHTLALSPHIQHPSSSSMRL